MEPRAYNYFAFISYSHKDLRAAAFVQRRLEHFRVPMRYVALENRPYRGHYVRPIFRDRRDLEVTANDFTDEIRQALAGSRYLLVLCSPDSAKSEWVDREVRFFLSSHRDDFGKVVPVVVRGNPGSADSTECLPAALRVETICRRNLPSMVKDAHMKESDGWEYGVVQSLSYMLGISREKVKATMDAERVRQLRIYVILGVLFSVVCAAFASWALRAEKMMERQRNLAEENRIVAERNAAEAARQAEIASNREKEAKQEREIAEKTLDFMMETLKNGDPTSSGRYDIRVADALESHAANIQRLEPWNLRAYVACRAGSILDNVGSHACASNLIFMAVELNDLHRSRSVEMAYSLYCASWWYFNQELYDRAWDCGKRALEIYETADQCPRLDLATMYNGMGVFALYLGKEQLVEARKYLRKAIEIRQCELGGDNVAVALSYSNLGFAYYREGKLELARQTHLYALRILRLNYGDNHVYVAKTLRGIGLISLDLGNLKEAIAVLNQAVAIRERLSGKTNRYLYDLQMELGIAYEKLGDHKRARSSYERALHIGSEVYGAESSRAKRAARRLQSVVK